MARTATRTRKPTAAAQAKIADALARAEMNQAADEQALPRYKTFTAAVTKAKSYQGALDILHAAALAADARMTKVNAMAAVEEFEIEGGRLERAFEDLCTHYSEGNALLILAQAEAMGLKVRGLRDVGGFNTMKDRGRAIIKGQRQVFFIWGKKVERKTDETETAPAANESETARKARSFYPIVGLFHISQTEDLAKAQARWAADKAAQSV